MGIQIGDPLVHRLALNPLSYASQGTHVLNKSYSGPDWIGSVGGVSCCKEKGYRFKTWSGYIPKLQVLSLGLDTYQRQLVSVFCIDVPLPLFLHPVPSL